MENNTQLPVEVATQIEKDATARYRATEEGKLMAVGYKTAATAYATKLQEAYAQATLIANKSAEWEKKVYSAWEENEELRRQNDKLKQQATGWRPLLEEALRENNHTAMYPDHFIDKITKFLYGE